MGVSWFQKVTGNWGQRLVPDVAVLENLFVSFVCFVVPSGNPTFTALIAAHGPIQNNSRTRHMKLFAREYELITLRIRADKYGRGDLAHPRVSAKFAVIFLFNVVDCGGKGRAVNSATMVTHLRPDSRL